MARLIITKSTTDLFVQLEWLSNFGPHSKRVTEEMPPAVRAACEILIDWANAHEESELRPKVEIDQEIRALEALIAKAPVRLADLKRNRP